ncbi:MAG: heavy metal translocating P-type ATPase [Planctomycetota bacterium]
MSANPIPAPGPVPAVPAVATAPMETTTLDITGMTCAGCVRRIERALGTVDGVAAAQVNLATNQARIEFDPVRVRPDDLAAVVVDAGYGASVPAAAGAATSTAEVLANDEQQALRADVVRALAATLPLLVLGMAHGAIPFADSTAGRWLQLLLGAYVVFGPGRRFLRQGLVAVRHRSPDMNTLVALGALTAWLVSAWTTIAGTFGAGGAHGGAAHGHVWFEAAGAIVAFVLLGKWLESRARWQLGDAVRALHALVPASAQVVERQDGRETERDVPVASLRAGQLVRVRPGQRVPGDGRVVDGASAVDESLLSGESLPVDKAVGAQVVGGSLVTTGSLLVQLERTGEATALARITAAVAAAQGSRAPIARFADRAAAVFVPIVLLLALGTLLTFVLLDPSAAGFAFAIERATAVLVIACPCALGLATPAAVAVGAGRGAALGVLFRTGAVLETASHVDAVFFDKTGTLTNGRPELVRIEPAEGVAEAELLALAAAVELGSEHPFGRAVVAAAKGRGLAVRPALGFAAVPARGVVARVDGALVRVGRASWLADEGLAVAAFAPRIAALANDGHSALLVARGEQVLGLLAFADAVRPEARAAVQELQALGVRVGMLSGDRAGVAQRVARELGIDDVAGELLPADKSARLAREQANGARVAMVGDGINDAPALAAADVGIVGGNGTDVAAAAADVALLRSGLSGVPTAIRLARATMATIRRNLLWASIYNLLGIPIAAGVFAGQGLVLSPVFASAAMSLSSVSVLASSLWLRRFRASTAEA